MLAHWIGSTLPIRPSRRAGDGGAEPTRLARPLPRTPRQRARVVHPPPAVRPTLAPPLPEVETSPGTEPRSRLRSEDDRSRFGTERTMVNPWKYADPRP